MIINVDDSGIMDLTQQMSTFSTQEVSWGPAPSPSPYLPSDLELRGLHSDGSVRARDSEEPALHSDLEVLAPVAHKSSLDDMQL